MIHLEQQRRCERDTVRYIIGDTIGEVGLIIATRKCGEGGDSQRAVGGPLIAEQEQAQMAP
jgi:hypothetical protein